MVVTWLCENVIWRLLRSFFHVTDSTFGRNELHFYRKRSWQAMWDKAVSGMLEDGSLKVNGWCHIFIIG